MRRAVLNTSDIDSHDPAWLEETERIESEMVAEIDEHGPFAPGDTLFATGHYKKDRLVWFDFLTAALDDIMRECAIPEGQREQRRLRYRSFTEDFLRHCDGAEKTLPLLDDQEEKHSYVLRFAPP